MKPVRRLRFAVLVAGLVGSTPGAAQVVDGPPDPGAAQEAALPPGAVPVVPDSLDGVRYARIEGGDITVRFAPRDSLVAERVLEFLRTQAALPGLPADVPRGVTVALAHTPAALDALTGGVVPEWRAGVAVPSLGLLVVPTGEGTRVLSAEGRRTLRHEWAHLGLHAHMGDLRVPRWFDEGYAQWASGGFDAAEAWRLRVLVALGRTPPLDSLALAWPRSRADAESAYLLTASALTFLLRESGPRGLALFLERWRMLRSFEDAFRHTFGVTSGQFEEDWKRHVKERYGWLFVLSHSAVFWLALTLGLLVMVRVRSRYDRERMARLRAGEEPERPAYWRDEEAAGAGAGIVDPGPTEPWHDLDADAPAGDPSRSPGTRGSPDPSTGTTPS
ncbi:MAG: hypothetical protein RH859_08565 [Longimicrobiales bacterium]